MNRIKPKKLNKGDLIGIINPASPVSDFNRINKSVEYFEKLGYKVKLGKNIEKQKGYLAGSEEERLYDLHNMFEDNEVKAVFCARGGYGSGKIISGINYKIIRQNPKIFVGYSDITALHLAFYSQTGLVTFAGPMPAVDFYDSVSPFTEEHFWNIITADKPIGKIDNPKSEDFIFLSQGRSEGKLAGGNLSVIVSLIGSKFFPDLNDSVLLLEDLNEPPYKIDRMLNQLKLAGVFNQVKGILLGNFKDCIEDDPNKPTLSLHEVFGSYFRELKKPVIYNLKHGHIKDNLTIPFGLTVKIYSAKGLIEIKESAVN